MALHESIKWAMDFSTHLRGFAVTCSGTNLTFIDRAIGVDLKIDAVNPAKYLVSGFDRSNSSDSNQFGQSNRADVGQVGLFLPSRRSLNGISHTEIFRDDLRIISELVDRQFSNNIPLNYQINSLSNWP